MFTVILISTVAILVAIVGGAAIWWFDASRAEEIDHPTEPRHARSPLGTSQAPTPPRSLDA